MDRKKLLTIGSVIGLLASGACFLPPPSRPPSIHRYAIKSVVVKVTDDSGSAFVDKDEFGRSIAEAINAQTQGQGPTAHFGDEARPEDAVLQVSIVKEMAASQRIEPGVRRWRLTMSMDATLSASNGAALGRLPRRVHHWRGRLPDSSQELASSNPAVRNWLNRVASQVAEEFLYGNWPSQ